MANSGSICKPLEELGLEVVLTLDRSMHSDELRYHFHAFFEFQRRVDWTSLRTDVQ